MIGGRLSTLPEEAPLLNAGFTASSSRQPTHFSAEMNAAHPSPHKSESCRDRTSPLGGVEEAVDYPLLSLWARSARNPYRATRFDKLLWKGVEGRRGSGDCHVLVHGDAGEGKGGPVPSL